MKYPVLSGDAARAIVMARLRGENPDLPNDLRWVGTGVAFDEGAFRDACEAILGELAVYRAGEEKGLKDQFEGRASGTLHAALAHLEANDLGVLDDPGFWRYVSVGELWELVRWREPAFARDGVEWHAIRKYVDGRNNAECVPLRMYLRGRLALVPPDNYSAASAVKRGTDLWRSHVIRVRASYSPELVRGFVGQVARYKIGTDEMRTFAKRVTRVGSNVVLSLYDDSEIRDLLEQLRAAEQSES